MYASSDGSGKRTDGAVVVRKRDRLRFVVSLLAQRGERVISCEWNDHVTDFACRGGRPILSAWYDCSLDTAYGLWGMLTSTQCMRKIYGEPARQL